MVEAGAFSLVKTYIVEALLLAKTFFRGLISVFSLSTFKMELFIILVDMFRKMS